MKTNITITVNRKPDVLEKATYIVKPSIFTETFDFDDMLYPDVFIAYEGRNYTGYQAKPVAVIYQDLLDMDYDWYQDGEHIASRLGNAGINSFPKAAVKTVAAAVDLHERALITTAEATATIMKVLTGKEYEHRTIKGCVQSEFAYIILPSCVDIKSYVAEIENRFFSLGSNWDIIVKENDCYMMTVYTQETGKPEARFEIADHLNCDLDEIVFEEDIPSDETCDTISLDLDIDASKAASLANKIADLLKEAV